MMSITHRRGKQAAAVLMAASLVMGCATLDYGPDTGDLTMKKAGDFVLDSWGFLQQRESAIVIHEPLLSFHNPLYRISVSAVWDAEIKTGGIAQKISIGYTNSGGFLICHFYELPENWIVDSISLSDHWDSVKAADMPAPFIRFTLNGRVYQGLVTKADVLPVFEKDKANMNLIPMIKNQRQVFLIVDESNAAVARLDRKEYRVFSGAPDEDVEALQIACGIIRMTVAIADGRGQTGGAQ